MVADLLSFHFLFSLFTRFVCFLASLKWGGFKF